MIITCVKVSEKLQRLNHSEICLVRYVMRQIWGIAQRMSCVTRSWEPIAALAGISFTLDCDIYLTCARLIKVIVPAWSDHLQLRGTGIETEL